MIERLEFLNCDVHDIESGLRIESPYLENATYESEKDVVVSMTWDDATETLNVVKDKIRLVFSTNES